MSHERRDGAETRERLLEAAGEVFAERGYRLARIVDICSRAEANVAAVNYHFGGKAALYAQVWRRAWEEALRVYPPDGGLPLDAPPEERLHARVRALLLRIFDDGRRGRFSRLLLMELGSPTPAVKEQLGEVLEPQIRDTRALLRELLGPDAAEEDVVLCHMSVIHQCLAFGWRRRMRRMFLGRERLTRKEVESVARHIADFSLAGIARVRERATVRPRRGTGARR
jgi:AcrR family transcriptional regulator